MATVSERQSRDGEKYNTLENVAMTLPQITVAITQVRAWYYWIFLFFKKKKNYVKKKEELLLRTAFIWQAIYWQLKTDEGSVTRSVFHEVKVSSRKKNEHPKDVCLLNE